MMNFLAAVGRWARYAYFLRFGLILWLFAPVFCLLNMKDQTLSSGILVSEFWQQYLCNAFFLVSASLAALILARIVLINGPARWGDSYNDENDNRPPLLKKLLVNDQSNYEFIAVILSQIPNAFVFGYLIWFGTSEGVDTWKILLGLSLGLALAFFFWWLADCWYYLTFRASEFKPPLISFMLGRNTARTILYPRRCYFLNAPGTTCPGKPTIEQANTILSNERLGLLERLKIIAAGIPGYGSVTDGRVHFYEAHSFATIALVVFGGLYLLLWPLTAPVPATVVSWIAIAVLFIALATLLLIFWTAKPASTEDRKDKSLRWIQVILSIAMLCFFGAVVSLRLLTSAERFPILATVLIMVTALCWLLAGIAFFLDRYRVPVLTIMLLSMFLVRLLPNSGQEEHYLSVVTNPQSLALPTPADILAARAPADSRPLIVVTATGGGIHASVWTATVLSLLEKEFGPDFHHHLLLASTVSGGSAGLLTYLREMHEGTLDSNPDLAFARMQSVAQCSSLEAVGWGLVYFDLPKAFVPALPYFIPPSSGDNDLDTSISGGTPLFKDRTWALRKSFDRNLNSKYCDAIWASDTNSEAAWGAARDEGVQLASTLTLRAFLDITRFPAITMNTTTVENGERFLSANYMIPPVDLDAGPNYRARSFLETFRTGTHGVTDLPLATAAQMSATFPVVSSTARVPQSLDNAPNSVHFADGGYYDNDGTASAIEFLRYAINAPPTSPSTKPARTPVRILLIEIRNSNDITGSDPETKPDHADGKTPRPWNLFDQVTAPLLGFWQAGHGSVTARDQSGLELLEKSLADKLQVHPVVFADICSTVFSGTDPLNWSLTPRQRGEVRQSAAQLQPRIQEAKDWFGKSQADWDQHQTAQTIHKAPDMVCALTSQNKSK
jgi:hypothetical protein